MGLHRVPRFIEECLSLNTNKDNLLFFRGEPRIYEKILPTIYTLKHGIENEDRIYKEIVAQFPREMAEQRFTVERLILMRHNELPTRLLDISVNPLVGLFFACHEGDDPASKGKDGRVYVFSIPEKDIKFCDSDTVTMLANLCKCKNDFNADDKKCLEYLQFEMREDKSYYGEAPEAEDLNKVVCLRGSMNNQRVIRQGGYFLIFGINKVKKNMAAMPKEWLIKDLKIPQNEKETILQELTTINITESFIYPDYKHLSRELARKYR